MRKLLIISRYHLNVIIIYAILTPLFFHLAKPNYDFNYNHFSLQISVVVLTLFLFLLFLVQNTNKIYFRFSDVSRALLYGIIFAVPEEIIFRSVIQGNLLSEIQNTAIVIFLSSFIFGMAHLLNNANNFYPWGWNWKLFALTFLAGIPLGTLFYLTNSLLMPTALHILFVTCLQLFKK